jgi:hypothetical protein
LDAWKLIFGCMDGKKGISRDIMINRRTFIKAVGAFCIVPFVPSIIIPIPTVDTGNESILIKKAKILFPDNVPHIKYEGVDIITFPSKYLNNMKVMPFPESHIFVNGRKVFISAISKRVPIEIEKNTPIIIKDLIQQVMDCFEESKGEVEHYFYSLIITPMYNDKYTVLVRSSTYKY